ncbi:unnamed protein product [Schistosoma margrebowiei]|uniref:Uncharacterized protein n=1 Tax=Schistosoma margrebowiei TaxID=48269 RepID=A0A183LDI9_9TREM|nr:unnamed protein product [Schistosoma margrebowiei]
MILSKEVRKALMECETRGSEIIDAYFRSKKARITTNVIQCYPFISDSSKNNEHQFYEAEVYCREMAEKIPNNSDEGPYHQGRDGKNVLLCLHEE